MILIESENSLIFGSYLKNCYLVLLIIFSINVKLCSFPELRFIK